MPPQLTDDNSDDLWNSQIAPYLDDNSDDAGTPTQQDQGDDDFVSDPDAESTTDEQHDSRAAPSAPEDTRGARRQAAEQPQPQAAQPPKGRAPRHVDPSQLTRDAHGNLLDQWGNVRDAQGNVVAFSGNQRKLYNEGQRWRSRAERAEAEVAQLRKAPEALLDGAPKRLGLSPQETQNGLMFVSTYKTNPAGVIRELIKHQLGLGRSIQDIIGDAAPQHQQQAPMITLYDRQGVAVQVPDPQHKPQQQAQQPDNLTLEALVTRAVNRAVEPLRPQAQQPGTDTDALRVRTREEVRQFFDSYPDASPHVEAIGHLVRNGFGLRDAWAEVEKFALTHGLDITRPLQPQVLAMKSGQRDNGNGVPSRQPGGVSGNPRNAAPTTEPEHVTVQENFDDIINQALNSAGYN